MLKKRSRATTSKQGLMPDHLHQPSSSLPSPTAIYNNRPTTSSLFPSPRLFVGFSAKGFSDSEAAMSPTSILETKPFSAAIGNPFFAGRTARRPIAETTTAVPHSDSKHHHHHHPWGNGDSVPIGLGIVDALKDEETGTKSSKPESRMVLFGSQLKIQIPPIPPASISPTGSMASLPHSPIEFGIKTKDSVLGSVSSPGGRRSTMGFANIGNEAEASPRVIVGSLSASEMEMSEDYTCVITHGPNPRTTHIFDNYIVESCSGSGFSASRKEKVFVGADRPGYPSDDFLSCCYACKKDLVKGKDIYMYRGEKAFCCRECRYQQMVFDEGVDMCPSEDL